MKNVYYVSRNQISDYLYSIGCKEYINLIKNLKVEDMLFGECERSFKQAETSYNARSAGFYAVGKALDNHIVPIIIDDKQRDIENLLSPLNEAYYQGLKLIILQTVCDGSEAIIPDEDIFAFFDVRIGDHGDGADELFENIKKSNNSVIMRIHYSDDIKSEKMSINIEEFVVSEIEEICKENSFSLHIATNAMPTDSFSGFGSAVHGIESIVDMGYGSLSYFVGQCIASPKSKHMLIIDADDFFSDMNALWVRGAKETNSVVCVLCSDKRSMEKVKRWSENLNIMYLDRISDFNGNMQVVGRMTKIER